MRRVLGAAVFTLVTITGCGRKQPPLTFDHAKEVFQSHLTQRFGDHLQILDWHVPNILEDVSTPNEFRIFSVAYELECLSPVDIAGLNEAHNKFKTDIAPKTFMHFTGRFEKVGSNYRILAGPQAVAERTLCVPGQKIDFVGSMSFRYDGRDWEYFDQDPEPVFPGDNPTELSAHSTRKVGLNR